MLFTYFYTFRFFNFFFYTIFIRNIFTSIHFRHFVLSVFKSFTIGSLLLAIFKCCFGFFSSMVNIELLIIFNVISYKFEFYDKVEYAISKILQNTLSTGMLDYRDETYDDFILLWDGEVDDDMLNMFYNKKHDVSMFNTIILHIFMFFIWLRLIILLEPLIYTLIYSMLIWLLIVNKWLIMIQVMVIIINISKICFTLNMYSMYCLKYHLNSFSNMEIRKSENSIKVTNNNVKIVSFIILSILSKEKYDLYETIISEKQYLEFTSPIYLNNSFLIALLIDYDIYYRNLSKRNVRLRYWPEYQIECKERIITITKILNLLIGPREKEKK